ncbi:hypothetical protein BDZ91DRAFT_760048 [Kalaharituber pfeilii]|nr:hypothetical protein BDZ91DRAFT_760048 [Kalaharituber pfeilii]
MKGNVFGAACYNLTGLASGVRGVKVVAARPECQPEEAEGTYERPDRSMPEPGFVWQRDKHLCPTIFSRLPIHTERQAQLDPAQLLASESQLNPTIHGGGSDWLKLQLQMLCDASRIKEDESMPGRDQATRKRENHGNAEKASQSIIQRKDWSITTTRLHGAVAGGWVAEAGNKGSGNQGLAFASRLTSSLLQRKVTFISL